jgi:hypothetical protein
MHSTADQHKPVLATLADLLAPVSTSEFLEVFRARKRLHLAASDPSRAETLFSWQDIDTLLSERALDEKVGILRDGTLVPRNWYTSSAGKQLNVSAFHDLLRQGASIVVKSVHCSVPRIGQLCAAIEREMGIDTNVNAYLSFFKGGAFKPHWDIMDVLVVQVHGHKQWRVWNEDAPRVGDVVDQLKVNTNAAPDQEFQMAPGDVLFIPRGEPHSAAVSSERCVHLSVGLLSQTGINFLDYLRREAAKDPLFRMDLPRHSSDEESGTHETALKHRLHLLIDGVSMSAFFREGDLSRLPMPQTSLSGALPRMEDVLRLTLRRRIPLPAIAPDGAAQPITIGGEARRLSLASIDVLRWLFDHDPATLRSVYSKLAERHGQNSIDGAIRELLLLGFIVVNPGD